MRYLPVVGAALLLAACGAAGKATPFTLTLDPTSLTSACPTLSAQVTVGGAPTVASFSVSQGGSPVSQNFSANNNVVVQIDADCLNAGGQSVGHSTLYQYGSATATPVNLTVRAPQAGDDPSRYHTHSGTAPSIQ